MSVMSLRQIQEHGLPIDVETGCGCCALPVAGALNMGDLLNSGGDADLGPGDDKILDLIFIDVEGLRETCEHRVATFHYGHAVKKNQEFLDLLEKLS